MERNAAAIMVLTAVVGVVGVSEVIAVVAEAVEVVEEVFEEAVAGAEEEWGDSEAQVTTLTRRGLNK
jgi:FMN-dependent NADH-azoreductase